MSKKLIYPLLLSLLTFFIQTALFPKLHLLAFAPLIVFIFLYSSYTTSLWSCCFIGLLVDLFSSTPIGIHSLCYTLTAVVLYRYKRFFLENSLNISLYTIVVSIMITAFEFIILSTIRKKIGIHPLLFISDLLIMPIIDGIYAFICFTFPIKIANVIQLQLKQYKAKRERH